MDKFSDRYGHTEIRSIAQLDSMDAPLRMALWNATYLRYFKDWDAYNNNFAHAVMVRVWTRLLNRDLASLPDNPNAGLAVKTIFDTGKWYEVYNLIEALATGPRASRLVDTYNRILEMHVSGYRIVGGQVTQLIDEQQVAEVEKALSESTRFAGANHHLKTALTLYSRLEKPDYANSIKESISAVEAVARELTGKATLGPALDQLKKDRPEIHPALLVGWKNLYGYTSDEAAIRHGGPNAPDISPDLARYFLVTCSAFVNLLIGYAE